MASQAKPPKKAKPFTKVKTAAATVLLVESAQWLFLPRVGQKCARLRLRAIAAFQSFGNNHQALSFILRIFYDLTQPYRARRQSQSPVA